MIHSSLEHDQEIIATMRTNMADIRRLVCEIREMMYEARAAIDRSDWSSDGTMPDRGNEYR